MKRDTLKNLKLLKSLYEATSRGEFSQIRDALDPNVEWIGPSLPGLWLGGTHRGAEAVWKEVIEPTFERFKNLRVEMMKFYDIGDYLIAIGHFHGRAKTTGKELEAATAHICTVKNGKITRFEAFHDSANWLEALGLAHDEPQRMAA
jgi:ketosteroid isomerase-like protein